MESIQGVVEAIEAPVGLPFTVPLPVKTGSDGLAKSKFDNRAIAV